VSVKIAPRFSISCQQKGAVKALDLSQIQSSIRVGHGRGYVRKNPTSFARAKEEPTENPAQKAGLEAN
jgi:hypothetical protein